MNLSTKLHKNANTHEKVLAKLVPEGTCLVWQGHKDKYGYGQVTFQRRTRLVHQIAWEFYRGMVPEGHEIHHTCTNRACANIDHLQVVTHKENVRSTGGWAAENARKTHCPRGHLYDITTTQGRWCSTCRRDYLREYQRKKRAEQQK